MRVGLPSGTVGNAMRLIALLAVLTGCAVGPDYRQPEAPTPAAYKELQGWKTATPLDSDDRGAWWIVFEDSLLDTLERQVEVSNQTLAANEAAFRQARAIVAQSRASLYPTITINGSVRRSKLGSGADRCVP